MGRLSTHVLDTSRGKPAENLVVDLFAVEGEQRRHLQTVSTNQDGRTDQPLLSGDIFISGVYELAFHAGDYFRRHGVSVTDPPFLDVVVIRFGVANSAGNYHVPLLVAPYGYSTYRGS